MTQIKQLAAKSKEASRLRQRKYQLVREHQIPENLVGGSLAQTHRRCGKANCHCASGKGHGMWSVTFCHQGRKRVERIPEQWRAELEEEVLRTKEYLAAIKEVMAINIELLAMTRRQGREKVRRSKKKAKSRSTSSAKARS